MPRTSSLGAEGSTPKRALKSDAGAAPVRTSLPWPLAASGGLRAPPATASTALAPSRLILGLQLPRPALPVRRAPRAVARPARPGCPRGRPRAWTRDRGSGRSGAGSGSWRRTGSCRPGWRSSGPRAGRPGCSGSSGRASGRRSPPSATARPGPRAPRGPSASARAHVVDRVVEASPIRAYQIRLTNAWANQGLSWPVTYEAASVRRRRPRQAVGQRRVGLRRGQEEPGGDRDLLLRVVLVGHRVARPALGHDLEDRAAAPACPCSDRPRPGPGEERGELVELLALPASRSGGRGTGRTGSARPGRSARPRRPARPACASWASGEVDRAVLVDRGRWP